MCNLILLKALFTNVVKWWNVMDAIRIRDDVKVTLKVVSTAAEEIPISLYLSSEALLLDHRNRTVRVSDVIPLPAEDELALLVMPFLRAFDDPPFRCRAECVETLTQMIQVRSTFFYFILFYHAGFKPPPILGSGIYARA